MKYDITDYQPSDQEELVRFFRTVFAEMGFDFDLTTKDRDLSRIPTEYQNRNGLFLLAKEKDIVVGTIGLRRIDDAKYELKRFYVLKTHRQLGIGTSLLNKATAKAHSGDRIRLDTTRKSPLAISLFKAHGFEKIPRFNDDPLAEIFMELKIEGANNRLHRVREARSGGENHEKLRGGFRVG